MARPPYRCMTPRQVGLIERVLRTMRSRLPVEAVRHHSACCIDEAALVRLLASYGVHVSHDDATHMMIAGWRTLRPNAAPPAPSAAEPLGGGAGGSTTTATTSTGSGLTAISWDQLLVSMPFWAAIMVGTQAINPVGIGALSDWRHVRL